ncbi:MAG: hypothetical protein ACLFTG_15415 [Alphaproteobacteria bacterium]
MTTVRRSLPGPPTAAAGVVQRRAGAPRAAAPHARPAAAQAFRLEPASRDRFRLAADSGPAGAPDGTYNFVRVQGRLPREAPTLVSARLPHARLADGRPVLYAGTAAFAQGRMEWWSNYSGTYQPLAAFRSRAGLPDDKFVPWQELQLGGHAQQRTTFRERRRVPPPAPVRPDGDEAKTGADAAGRAS